MNYRDVVEWFVNLHHGVSRGGGKPTDDEWRDCIDTGKRLLDSEWDACHMCGERYLVGERRCSNCDANLACELCSGTGKITVTQGVGGIAIGTADCPDGCKAAPECPNRE